MSTGKPEKCTGMIARVFSVNAASSRPMSMLRERSSISTNFGVAPRRATTFALAAKLMAGTMTSSPRRDAGDAQRDFEPLGRGGQHAHRAAAADVGAERRLEGKHLWSARELAGAQHRGNRGNAVLIDRWAGERQKFAHAELLETSTTPTQINAMPNSLADDRVSPNHIIEAQATTM